MSNTLRYAVAGALIALTLGGLAMQRATIISLQDKIAAARRQAAVARSSDSNGVQPASRSSLAVPSKDFTSPVSPRSSETRTAETESPWQDRGDATPEFALETAMWAASRGDMEKFSRLLVFEPKAREVITSLRAKLPASSRTEFPTDESLAALLLARQAPLEGVEVIGRSDVADGGVLLRVEMSGPNRTHKPAEFAFVQKPDGWRLVVTSELAAHAAHLLQAK